MHGIAQAINIHLFGILLGFLGFLMREVVYLQFYELEHKRSTLLASHAGTLLASDGHIGRLLLGFVKRQHRIGVSSERWGRSRETLAELCLVFLAARQGSKGGLWSLFDLRFCADAG